MDFVNISAKFEKGYPLSSYTASTKGNVITVWLRSPKDDKRVRERSFYLPSFVPSLRVGNIFD